MNQVSRKAAAFAIVWMLGSAVIIGAGPLAAQTAMNLNGFNQRVEVPSAPDLMNPGLITVECWARPTLDGPLVCKGDGIGAFSDRSFDLRYTNQRFEWDIFLPSPRWASLTSAVYPPGVFHHVAGTYNAAAGRARLYVDGVLAGETTLGTDGLPLAGALIRQSTPPVVFGRAGVLPQLNYSGDLDAVRIWTVERSRSDVADCLSFDELGYRSGLAASYALNLDAVDPVGGHNGALIGAPTFVTPTWMLAPVVYGGYAAVQNPLPSGTTALTVEAWVDASAGTTGRILSIGDGNSVSSTRSLDLSYASQNFTSELFTGPVGTNGYSVAISPAAYPPGTWHHVAATFSSVEGENRLYVDGSLVAMSTQAGNGAPGSLAGTVLRDAPNYWVRIGSDVYGLSFPGRIEEVRIWGYARSAHAIREAMDRRLDAQVGQLASLHLDGDVTNTTGGWLTSSGSLAYYTVPRGPSFHVAAAVGLGGAFNLAMTSVPASTVEGYLVASLSTAFNVGSGPVFGLTPDSLTFSLIVGSPVATPGNTFHWTYPVAPSIYPNAPFAVPAGVSPADSRSTCSASQ